MKSKNSRAAKRLPARADVSAADRVSITGGTAAKIFNVSMPA